MKNKNTFKGKRLGHKMPMNDLPNITVENEHTFTVEELEHHVRRVLVRWEKVEQMYDKNCLLAHGDANNEGYSHYSFDGVEWNVISWALDLVNKGCKTDVAYIKWLADGSYIELESGEYNIVDNGTYFPENEYDIYPQPIVSADGKRRNYHSYNRNTERGCK